MSRIISSYFTLEREINSRIGKASAAFGQLKHRIYLNRNLKLSTNIRMYNAKMILVLLYVSETRATYSKQLGLLNAFHLRCLHKILRISWQDRVRDDDVFSCCNCNTKCIIAAERILR